VHVLGSYMGEAWAMGGGYVSMYGLCNRSGFVEGSLQNIYLLSDDIAPMHKDIGQASWTLDQL